MTRIKLDGNRKRIKLTQVGKRGPQGIQGIAATIQIGQTTTVSPGSPASVVNVGNPNDAILDFEIPQGIQGPVGVGVEPGGTAGQVLRKETDSDYDTEWHTPTKSDVGLGNVPNLDTTQAVNQSHTHSNKSVLDATSASYTAAEKDKLATIEHNAQVNTVDSVNGHTGEVVLDADDLEDVLTNKKFVSQAEKDKLAGIAAGAEVNVQSDWNASSGDAHILNKPTLGTAAATAATDYATAAQGARADTAVQPATLTAHTSNTSNPHGVTKAQVGLGNVDNTSDSNKPISTATQIALDSKADLVNGKVPEAQLPSFVDDVLSFNSQANFPATGEDGKIYIAKDTNLTYRWTGSAYTEISPSLALGETSATAYRGDRGKTAYDHTLNTSNPHGVTKAQVGLGNVSNLAPADLPVSTATQSALNAKANASDTVNLTGNQTVVGVKTFSSSPVVPTATTNTQAVNKAQMDAADALKVDKAGDTMTGQLITTDVRPSLNNSYTNGTSGNYWNELFTASIRLGGSSDPRIIRGTGFPNGVVTAPVGSTYIDRDATNGAIEWKKATGTGNTGWVVSVGDTGWRDITSLFGTQLSTANPNDYGVLVLRKGNVISLNIKAAIGAGYTGASVVLPLGFKSGTATALGLDILNLWQTAGTNTGQAQIGGTFGFVSFTSTAAGTRYYGSLHTLARSAADNIWPATLPGTQISAPGIA